MNYNFKLYLQSKEAESLKKAFAFYKDDSDEVMKDGLETFYNVSKDSMYVKDLISFIDLFYFHYGKMIEMTEGVESVNLVDFYYDNIDAIVAAWDLKPREVPTVVPMLSLALYYFVPDSLFYPVLFEKNFKDFQNRCARLGIAEIENMPLQKDIELRIELYLQICDNIEQFRVQNELTREEVCALIYDYAPKCINQEEDTDVEAVMPNPTNIWFAGASKYDYDTSLKEDVSIWQGNPDTQKGDIVILYALSPHSHIHSVWRAVKDCTFNPFDLYCDRIMVGHRIEVPHVSIKALKEDPSTNKIPIVKKNLQGLNGVRLSVAEYKALQALMLKEDPTFDLSQLPQIQRPDIVYDFDIENEKEKGVEEHLLIPLLKALGYSPEQGDEWHRQFVIKMGRSDKEIPDFVFFPKRIGNQAVAPMVIEAKLDFKNPRQRSKDFNQGLSYARTLHSQLLGICDKEEIRIYKADKHGMFYEDKSNIFIGHWSELKENGEIFNNLKRLIGRDVVSKIK